MGLFVCVSECVCVSEWVGCGCMWIGCGCMWMYGMYVGVHVGVHVGVGCFEQYQSVYNFNFLFVCRQLLENSFQNCKGMIINTVCLREIVLRLCLSLQPRVLLIFCLL